MRSILIVSGVSLFPTTSGSKRRIFNLINNFRAQGVKVYYLWVTLGKENIIPMKKLFGKNLFVYNGRNSKMNFRTLSSEWLREALKFTKLEKKIIIKYRADDRCPKGLPEYVGDLAKKINVDAVMCEYIFYSSVLQKIPEYMVKIIDTHDKMTDRHKLYLDKKSELPFFYTSAREEKRALERADVIIAIQKEEEKYFRRLTDNKKTIITVGDCIDVSMPYLVKNKKVVFLGSSYRMNVLACEYFIQKILPIIHQMDSEIEFLIAGSVCSELPKSSHYKKLGVVDRVEDIYRASRLVVNPSTLGTGLNIKTVEALAYAKPLVTTPKGARGIREQNGALFVAKSERDFAEAVVKIANNDETAMRLSQEAVRFIESYNAENMSNLMKLINMNEMG